ncbi:MAG: hypothetical protein JO090_15605, partial [Rhizobacter sp.]|nr:hypothetical protein [Rhizobacter sp.]
PSTTIATPPSAIPFSIDAFMAQLSNRAPQRLGDESYRMERRGAEANFAA